MIRNMVFRWNIIKSRHVTSCHVTSRHDTSSGHINSNHISLRHTASYRSQGRSDWSSKESFLKELNVDCRKVANIFDLLINLNVITKNSFKDNLKIHNVIYRSVRVCAWVGSSKTVCAHLTRCPQFYMYLAKRTQTYVHSQTTSTRERIPQTRR